MNKEDFIKEARRLEANYKPSDKVKQHIAKVELIPTVGPTGSGKTSIMIKSGIFYVLGDVTRRPRDGEIDGVEYNFRTDYGKLLEEIKNGEFLQYYVSIFNEFYGTKDSAFPLEGPSTFAIIARIIPNFYRMGFKFVRPVYILPPSFEEWMRRVGIHNDDDVQKRMEEAQESLNIALKDDTYIFLLNDNIETATEEFKRIAKGEIDTKHSSFVRAQAEKLYQQIA